ncbi:hypothetical protein ACFL96_02515 [Thermoproteota archaeon]
MSIRGQFVFVVNMAFVGTQQEVEGYFQRGLQLEQSGMFDGEVKSVIK